MQPGKITKFISGLCTFLIFFPLATFFNFGTLLLLSVGSLVCYVFLELKSQKKFRIKWDGHVSPGFEKVAEVFRESLASRQEQGAAFAVYHNGELVVDLWGRYSDYEALRYRKKDSTSMAYSATKVTSAICIAILVDRGLLDYKCPVYKYWPEFGQTPVKKTITVEMILSHRSGLITIREKHKLGLLRDNPDEMGRLLAKQEPFWVPGQDQMLSKIMLSSQRKEMFEVDSEEIIYIIDRRELQVWNMSFPGTAQGYHTLTLGLYADQLIRRVDPSHRSLSQFFREEVAIPFGIDFMIGEPKSEYYRACRETRGDFGWLFFFTTTIPTSVMFVQKAIYSLFKYRAIHLLNYVGNPTDWKPRKLNDPDFREIECGSSHGFGTARGLAKLLGILANGGRLDDKVLLSPKLIDYLNTPLSNEFDRVVLRDIIYGPGTTIQESTHGQKKSYIFGHWGAGGQMTFADPNNKLGWAYLTNYCNVLHGFIIDHRYSALEKALYECIDDMDKNQVMRKNVLPLQMCSRFKCAPAFI